MCSKTSQGYFLNSNEEEDFILRPECAAPKKEGLEDKRAQTASGIAFIAFSVSDPEEADAPNSVTATIFLTDATMNATAMSSALFSTSLQDFQASKLGDF